MTVRRKTFVLIALTCAGLMAVLYTVAYIIILKADLPRTIYHDGLWTQYYFVGSMLAAGFAFWIVIQITLERTVLARLSALNRCVAQIASSGDVSARVTCDGKDELSNVAFSINHVLDSL